MSDKDLRFEPVKMEGDVALLPDTWKFNFWASAGELSRFFVELKENARLMGTKCPTCGSVYCWPRSWCHECYAECDWVEMSGKGRLTVFSRVEISLSEIQKNVPFFQGGVHLEEARYPIVAFLKPAEIDGLSAGMQMRVEFLPARERTGRTRDFFFVPDQYPGP